MDEAPDASKTKKPGRNTCNERHIVSGSVKTDEMPDLNMGEPTKDSMQDAERETSIESRSVGRAQCRIRGEEPRGNTRNEETVSGSTGGMRGEICARICRDERDATKETSRVLCLSRLGGNEYRIRAKRRSRDEDRQRKKHPAPGSAEGPSTIPVQGEVETKDETQDKMQDAKVEAFAVSGPAERARRRIRERWRSKMKKPRRRTTTKETSCTWAGRRGRVPDLYKTKKPRPGHATKETCYTRIG